MKLLFMTLLGTCILVACGFTLEALLVASAFAATGAVLQVSPDRSLCGAVS